MSNSIRYRLTIIDTLEYGCALSTSKKFLPLVEIVAS